MGKRKLGRGLGMLLGRRIEGEAGSSEVLQIPIGQIKPNPWQPRSDVRGEAFQGLVDSIRAKGVLQPILVRRRKDGGYEIIAGERRWRAAGEAGLSEMPAAIRDASDAEMPLLALMENIQREDLDPIERANAYVTLMRTLGWTQEQLAEHVSEARATIANSVRLLELPQEIQALVSRGTLSAGHGRALAGIRDAEAQKRLCRQIIRENLSVRDVEELVSGSKPPGTVARRARLVPPHIRELQERLSGSLGARVTVKERKRGGRVIIDFRSHEDFERVLGMLEGGRKGKEGKADFHV
jgi:ParB family chromosome partitioning protein